MSRTQSNWERPPRYMTQAEVKQFLASIPGLRDQVLFSLIYLYGLRVSETALLCRGDIEIDRGRILIRRVKGGSWSERPLFSGIIPRLGTYLQSLKDQSPTNPCFPGRAGPLRKRRIQALFTHYKSSSGIPRKYTCHSLRHSIATHLLDAGCELRFVQDHLGHRSIQSTTIYARVTNRHREAVFRKLEKSPWVVDPGDVSRGPENETTGGRE